jgi:hypothetical protein
MANQRTFSDDIITDYNYLAYVDVYLVGDLKLENLALKEMTKLY